MVNFMMKFFFNLVFLASLGISGSYCSAKSVLYNDTNSIKTDILNSNSMTDELNKMKNELEIRKKNYALLKQAMENLMTKISTSENQERTVKNSNSIRKKCTSTLKTIKLLVGYDNDLNKILLELDRKLTNNNYPLSTDSIGFSAAVNMTDIGGVLSGICKDVERNNSKFVNLVRDLETINEKLTKNSKKSEEILEISNAIDKFLSNTTSLQIADGINTLVGNSSAGHKQ